MESEHKVWATGLVCTAAVVIAASLCARSCSMSEDKRRATETRECLRAGASLIGGECIRGCK